VLGGVGLGTWILAHEAPAGADPLGPDAALVFAMSPLVPLDDASRGNTYLLVALGFLSGFSERFAQDMFVRSGQGLAGPGGDAPSRGLSAGLAPPAGNRAS